MREVNKKKLKRGSVYMETRIRGTPAPRGIVAVLHVGSTYDGGLVGFLAACNKKS